MAVKEDAYASQTKLTITVRVRYANRVNPDEDFEQSFSAYREFDATQMLQQVQASYRKRLLTSLSIKFIMQRLPTGKNESC